MIFETADSRTASLALNILYYDPPVYTQSGGSAVVAEALTKDLTFEVGYTHEEAYTMKVNGAALAAENFTATWANNKITVALKKEYINALTQGAYTFELTTLAGKVEYSVYRKTAANEWVLVDAEKPVVEEKVEKNAKRLYENHAEHARPRVLFGKNRRHETHIFRNGHRDGENGRCGLAGGILAQQRDVAFFFQRSERQGQVYFPLRT